MPRNNQVAEDAVPPRRCVRIIVSGRVQGVAFRYYTRALALQLGLNGWVCNRSDGSVEILAQGTQMALEELVRWTHQGPPAARVRKVTVTFESPSGEYDDFRIERQYS